MVYLCGTVTISGFFAFARWQNIDQRIVAGKSYTVGGILLQLSVCPLRTQCVQRWMQTRASNMRSWRLTASVMGNIQGFFFVVVARSLVSAGGSPYKLGWSITLLNTLHDCPVFWTHCIEVSVLIRIFFSPFFWPIIYLKFVVATIKNIASHCREIVCCSDQHNAVRLLWAAPRDLISHGTVRLSLDGFSWNMVFEYFLKLGGENSSFIKIW
jgi:hypothetical protein